MSKYKSIAQAMKNEKVNVTVGSEVKVYSQSFNKLEGTKLLMIKDGYMKLLLAVGDGDLFNDLQGNIEESYYKVCQLTHENRLVLNQYFDYTLPRAFGTEIATIGLGDRLGVASPGHIKTMRDKNIRPILAQQSIRELTLTNRNFNDVLDAAAYAVFQEGYKNGYGADADHLKFEEDIQMALDCGYTMLTLDCSEKIDNTIVKMSDDEKAVKYVQLPYSVRKHYESQYLNQTFQMAGSSMTFDKATLIDNVLIYYKAIDYMELVYQKHIKKAPRDVDFEISIDETETSTAPESHFFVAKELYSRELEIYSIAPRFCGEFQKGIDYIGDITQFEKELKIHAGIADDFGYKLSIHSGSDKFSVFSLIGKYTKGRFHVKTAGTNWLEAVRTIAKVNPTLYRRMHQYALEHFEEATAYYHVSTNLSKIVPLDQIADSDLSDTYMNEDNARQLIHITYGILLQAKDAQGNSLFKDEIYYTLSDQEALYEQSLILHIGKHLDLLGIV